MPPTSHGRAGPQGRDSFTHGSSTNGHGTGLPPSTLAAQLVDAIPAPNRSTRPDEAAELKKLFGLIEKVKNQPELLQSVQERVEHNHMLIYVYARVVLEGLDWDDAHAEVDQLQTDALRAISFLNVTIRETPQVLLLASDGVSFIFRGREPLWLWILPKVLKMLRHSQCMDLTEAIEGFFQHIYSVIFQSGFLWPLIPQLSSYLRSSFHAIYHELTTSRCPVPARDLAVHLSLPPDSFLEQVASENVDFLQQHCTYRLQTTSHALRHAAAILAVMSIPLRRHNSGRGMMAAPPEDIVWLLDAYSLLVEVQKRWREVSFLPLPVEEAMRILASTEGMTDVDVSLREKAYVLLLSFLIDALAQTDGRVAGVTDEARQQTLCPSLVKMAEGCLRHKPVARLVSTQLVPALDKQSMQGEAMVVGNDIWRCRELLLQAASDPRPSSLKAILQPEQFTDESLGRQVGALHLWPRVATAPAAPEERPSKRRKMTEEDKTLPQVLMSLFMLLGSEYTGDVGKLRSLVRDQLPQLSDDRQVAAISLLAHLCCSADDTLIIEKDQEARTSTMSCSYCDCSSDDGAAPSCLDVAAKSMVTELFAELIVTPSFLEKRKSRIMAMLSLRRLARHSGAAEVVDLHLSPLAQWCLQSLRSSIRELRIAAGRTLAVFLTDAGSGGASAEVIGRNRGFALGLLRTLSEQNEPKLAETCIMAWAQAGRVVPQEQLKLVLMQLVEYLGHDGVVAPAIAFNEILNLARYHGLSTRQLFEPFWAAIAFSAVKELDSRPRTAYSLAQVLEVTVVDVLVRVQRHALPWLVLSQKQGVVQQIAEMLKTEAWQLCVDNDNLGAILALLLSQDRRDVEASAMGLLRHISPHFNDLNLVELLQMEPLMTALELLKAAADADETGKAQIRQTLDMMAKMIQAANGDSKQKKHATTRFLQQHALGLMARLTDVINDTSSTRAPVGEQERCIKAMEEMINIGGHHVRIARPQISACLLSAMAVDELRQSAFSCWAAMFLRFDYEDMEVLMETTFFIIKHYWHMLGADGQAKARRVVESDLFDQSKEKARLAVLKQYINKLPSFGGIDALADLEAELNKLRERVDNRTALGLLAERISHEMPGVVLQALQELCSYLQKEQAYLQASAVSEQPDGVVARLARALLDCAARYKDSQPDISRLCTQAIGLMGCLDPNRVESVRAERQMVILNNLENSHETTDFVLFLLDHVLTKSFVAATDTKLQGLLSYAMQELLERCDIGAAIKMSGPDAAAATSEVGVIYRKYLNLSEGTREILTPFLSSKYVLVPMAQPQTDYPVFRLGRRYGSWMRSLALDLLHRPQNAFAQLIFEPLCRVIRVKDLSTAEFLLPYLVLHVVIGDEGAEEDRAKVVRELWLVMQHELAPGASHVDSEDRKLYCEAVFRVLDYAMRWLHSKRAQSAQSKQAAREAGQMAKVQHMIDSIPAELISQRAVECKAYSRALFHLEQHIRQVEGGEQGADERQRLLQRLQDIYAQIDDPDGLEGISAHVHVVDINRQILSDRKAARWNAVQTWYEMKLAREPDNVQAQLDLLTCLKESGQHDVLLNYVQGFFERKREEGVTTMDARVVPYAVEAAWATGRWQTMESAISKYQGDASDNFNVCLGRALLHLQKGRRQDFVEEMRMLRERVGSCMTHTVTASLQACHEAMLKCHVLTDLDLIAGTNMEGSQQQQQQQNRDETLKTMKTLERRLEVLGSYVNDKQYVLGIRRAAMELMRPRFGDGDMASLWLASARLARKSNSMHQSHNAVLHALQLGDENATMENARLLWNEGHPRKAIETLRRAIGSGLFSNQGAGQTAQTGQAAGSGESRAGSQQSLLTARAHLLLAKWLDRAGQTHASALRQQYQNVPKDYGQWEKGHYYLGRHYKKVLESERALKPDKQSAEYLSGETAKLVIENYIRSLNYGTKYIYQTIPRVLTLWLELGQPQRSPDGKVSLSNQLYQRRQGQLQQLHEYLRKHIARMPAYIFYTALPQMVARITHPNPDVFGLLRSIIVKVVEAHPRQALWSVLGIMPSIRPSPERKARANEILTCIKGVIGPKPGPGLHDLRTLLRMGEKLAQQLLAACNNGDFQSNRTTQASISKDLAFQHACTPCPLVVPVEACLTATLPTLTDKVRKHQAFSRDVITIHSFLDHVVVLGSLAKPRKLTARGSDGKNYGLLCKPKDDLRTDQRLMEFNSMINRSLKRDAESSRRQLYIRTYAVTPLNEECGIIEWIEGLKTLRDILLAIYRSRGIVPNYNTLAQMMKDACLSDKNLAIFSKQVLGMFPPVLHHWFVSQFPNPSAWFAARLKYTRSAAVMSMVGTILGLGDRHGENMLLEEGNGGVFHVDFNCLFDKGLTFSQPERVPFRLTHNMVAAMGVYGYDGPFRRSAELALSVMRLQEETLLSILEAFIYDPTLDLQKGSGGGGEQRRRKGGAGAGAGAGAGGGGGTAGAGGLLNPTSVVESIRRKVRGLLPHESIPLGVEGQVDELIRQAVDPRNLAGMYIGWCPFL